MGPEGPERGYFAERIGPPEKGGSRGSREQGSTGGVQGVQAWTPLLGVCQRAPSAVTVRSNVPQIFPRTTGGLQVEAFGRHPKVRVDRQKGRIDHHGRGQRRSPTRVAERIRHGLHAICVPFHVYDDSVCGRRGC